MLGKIRVKIRGIIVAYTERLHISEDDLLSHHILVIINVICSHGTLTVGTHDDLALIVIRLHEIIGSYEALISDVLEHVNSVLVGNKAIEVIDNNLLRMVAGITEVPLQERERTGVTLLVFTDIALGIAAADNHYGRAGDRYLIVGVGRTAAELSEALEMPPNGFSWAR